MTNDPHIVGKSAWIQLTSDLKRVGFTHNLKLKILILGISATVSLILLLFNWSDHFGIYVKFFGILIVILTGSWIILPSLMPLREPLLGVAVPVLVASFYLVLLLQDQVIEAIRAVNEAVWWKQLLNYWFWVGSSIYMMCALYFSACIGLGVKDTSPGSLSRQNILMLTVVIVLPWSANIIGEWYADGPWWSLLIFIIIFSWGISEGCRAFHKRDIPFFRENLNEFGELGSMLFSSSFFIGTLIVVIIGSFLSAHLDVVPPIFLAGWCTFIAAIVQLMRKWEGQVRGWVGFRFPIFIVVLVLVLVLSVFDLSDNHELPFARTQKSPEKASSAFAAWLERDKSTVGPSTVFIVAAEGGGARAAYMTALALEKMRARCSAFQHRLFAVIGVSGGSVGAALSAAAAKWRPPFVGPADCSHIEAPARLAEASKKESPTVKAADTEEEPKEPAAVAAAGTDLLRPLLRGGLTLDLLMRALPGSLLQTHGVGGSKSVDRNFFQKWFDRSSYLDWRLDLAWREQASEQSIRDRLFLDVWPGLTGDVPALILLATDVSSGRRVAISHLQFSEEDIPEGNDGITCLSPFQKREEESADEAEKALSRRTRLLTTAEIAPGRDLPLLEAAFVSARFPIVTPAATLPCPRKVVVRLKNGGEKKVNTRWRLVDGGYFENSGLTTALELADAIKLGAKDRSVRLVIVRLENGGAATNRSNRMGAPPKPSDTSFNELMSPLRAFYGTREAQADQARLAVDRAVGQSQEDKNVSGGKGFEFQQVIFRLQPCDVEIPLGWSLSDRAKAEIRQQLSLAEVDQSDRRIDKQEEAKNCVQKIAEANRAGFNKLSDLATGRQ